MTLTTQFLTIIFMIAGGAYVGAAMDTFERLFHRRNRKSWMEFVRQLFFWLFQAAILFYLLYLANYGELRIYVFVALVCGFALYRSLLQKHFLEFMEIGIRMGVAIFRMVKKTVYYLIIWPVKTIIFLIVSLLLGVYSILLKGIFLLCIVVFYPIKLLFWIIWRLLPKNMKNYLSKLAGFWDEIKNTLRNWKKRIRK